jgi:hypothetical protein
MLAVVFGCDWYVWRLVVAGVLQCAGVEGGGATFCLR